jgi:acetoin:2,6-dichlorophenolindophenol oxidoreductase subunit beta
MTRKTYAYAVLEGVAHEMRRNPALSLCYEFEVPVARLPTGEVLDLAKEFGTPRTSGRWGWPIDEAWYAGWATGMALTGCPAIARIPYQAAIFPAEFVSHQIAKLRYMAGGQANLPLVLWIGGAGRRNGYAGQHTDVGEEAFYAYLPGLKVVAPGNAYDAKGLMIAAIRDPDPVVFREYSEVTVGEQPEVPDDAYEVPIGKAVVRQEGKDFTLVAWAPATIDVARALPKIAEAGISAEYIDLRTIKPVDVDTLTASVKKTRRLLVVDHGNYTNGFGSHVVAEMAQKVSGAKFARIAFPDAPGPGARAMMSWMRPDAPKIVDAAQKLIKA